MHMKGKVLKICKNMCPGNSTWPVQQLEHTGEHDLEHNFGVLGSLRQKTLLTTARRAFIVQLEQFLEKLRLPVFRESTKKLPAQQWRLQQVAVATLTPSFVEPPHLHLVRERRKSSCTTDSSTRSSLLKRFRGRYARISHYFSEKPRPRMKASCRPHAVLARFRYHGVPCSVFRKHYRRHNRDAIAIIVSGPDITCALYTPKK